MSDLTGKSFGRYHILEQMGEGGMAIVYKAYDTRLETDVAVKIIRMDNILPSILKDAFKRFEREGKLLARLTHPNIVKVIDYGEYEGMPYLVMPFLPGGTIKSVLGKPMPWQEAIQLVLPIAEALDYAHSQNMIHRDVKPSNILLTERGQPMLSDFGIAKILDLENTQELTGTSMMMGTPEYMAPEQVAAKTVDHRADIYALGIVLYEMVAGRQPFLADTPMAVLIKHSTEPLPRPREFAPSLPEDIERVLLKALAKRPEDRYQNMGEFALALRRNFAEGVTETNHLHSQPFTPTAADEKKAAPVARQPQPKQRWQIFGLGAAAVGLICLMATASILLVFSERIMGWIGILPSPTGAPAVESTSTLPVETITVVPTAFSARITDGKGVSMSLIPAGEFAMGNEHGDKDEAPVHTVELGAFYMDVYEVTNSLYKGCVDDNVCNPPLSVDSITRPAYYENPDFGNYPVIHVNWDMANAFCAWRGARLPTEAEWEKAARGPSTGSGDDRLYPWGGEINCELTNYNSCEGDTTPVGSYESGQSPYGLFDMAGNVWEWVNDWYAEDYYAVSPLENPEGPPTGDSHALRGGAWDGNEHLLRVSMRGAYFPEDYFGSVGFRCAADARP